MKFFVCITTIALFVSSCIEVKATNEIRFPIQSLIEFQSSWWWNSDEKKTNPFRVEQLTGLADKLEKNIIGQSKAIETTVGALMCHAMGFRITSGPIATLLYIGPTGVGKTQLAKELAKELLGDEDQLVRLNMSEYATENGLYRLLGPPPGYQDHKIGGQLTNALKKNPYAIVLIDEIEKAHSSVLKVFLQVFDEGFIIDSAGSKIDCQNMLFILTSNLGAQEILTKHDLG